jgi:hypothetical protein
MKYISAPSPKREECDVSSGSQNSNAPSVRHTPHDSVAPHDSEGKRTQHDPQDCRPTPVGVRCPSDDGTSIDQQQQPRHDPRQHREADQEAAGEPAQRQRYMVEERPQARQGRREGRVRRRPHGHTASGIRLNVAPGVDRGAEDDCAQDHRPEVGRHDPPGDHRSEVGRHGAPRRHRAPHDHRAQVRNRRTADHSASQHGTPHHRAFPLVPPSPGGLFRHAARLERVAWLSAP